MGTTAVPNVEGILLGSSTLEGLEKFKQEDTIIQSESSPNKLDIIYELCGKKSSISADVIDNV